MQTHLQSQNFTITTDGMYLAVYDTASSVNKSNLWKQSLQQAKIKAGDTPTALFHFNQTWFDYMDARQLLAWPLMFDGVYRVRIKVAPGTHTDYGEKVEFIGNCASALIDFPTGTAVIGNLSHVGNTPDNVISLPAGLYQASLFGNEEQQQDHMFLTNIAEYPDEDGPDWTVLLQKME